VLSTAPASDAGRLPYVVLRNGGRTAYYKRQWPAPLRASIGATTCCIRLEGHPAGGPRERARFASSYSRADAQAEETLAMARAGERVLTPQEQVGAAGAWAASAGPQERDTVDRSEVAAVLRSLSALGLVLPMPIPDGWAPGPIANPQQLVSEVRRLALRLHDLDHPGAIAPLDGDAVWGDRLQSPAAAAAFLAEVVHQSRAALQHWISEAREQLNRLGVIVDPAQQQSVALRLATTSAALGQQAEQIEQGVIPAPLTFPDPPAPSSKPQTKLLATRTVFHALS
jgi:hypothetical protein